MSKKQLILDKISNSPNGISNSEIADSLGISRAYSHRFISELLKEGLVVLIGQTNQAKYFASNNKETIKKAKRKIDSISLKLTNKDLNEDTVLNKIEKETGILLDTKENISKIFRYAFTEMLNNAIDHSQSEIIEVSCHRSKTSITCIVRDFGIGIFNNVRDKFRLPGTMDAIQEILKGKTTTDPINHSGEGIFFTSKMTDIFIADSYGKTLTVNNLASDVFITDRAEIKGTRITFTVGLESKKTTENVFRQFTGADDDYEFNKTRIAVKLFNYGSDLPSRSQAKRIVLNLEHFEEIEMDFSGVETVGQGFADQIFRVWQSQHPHITLIATNANENIAFMIKRAGGNVA